MRNPNGYGSVYKLSGKRRRPFIAVVSGALDENGRYPRTPIGYYATRREALRAISEYNEQPYDIKLHDITMAELWERWKVYRQQRGKSLPSNYVNAYKHCAPLHDTRFIDITTIQIQDTVDAMKDHPHTAGHMRMIFGLLYKYARLINLTDINQAKGVEVPHIPKSTMHKPFTEEELATLWTQTSDFAVRVALIYCYTGLRPSELLTMRRENVFLEKRYMIGGMKTEAGRNRVIPIAEKIVPFIEELLARDDEEYLFTLPNGQRPKNLKAFMACTWQKSASPIIRAHLPHDGRHTCETMLDNVSTAKRTIQLIVGHAGQDIDEKVYTHKTIGQLIAAVNMF